MVTKSASPKITMRLSRVYGNDKIEIEITSDVDRGDEQYEMNRVNDLLKQGIMDWTNNIAPQLKAPSAIGQYSDATSDAWYDVSDVVVSYDKGKRWIKAIAGQWQEYGVVIYPEVFKAVDIPFDKIPDTGFKPKTWKVRIIERPNKPPRIIELTFDKAENAEK